MGTRFKITVRMLFICLKFVYFVNDMVIFNFLGTIGDCLSTPDCSQPMEHHSHMLVLQSQRAGCSGVGDWAENAAEQIRTDHVPAQGWSDCTVL